MNEKRMALLEQLTCTKKQITERIKNLPWSLSRLDLLKSLNPQYLEYWNVTSRIEGFTPDDALDVVRLKKYFERVEEVLQLSDDQLLGIYNEFDMKFAELITTAQIYCLQLKSYFLREPNLKGRVWLCEQERLLREAITNALESKHFLSGDYVYLAELLTEKKALIKSQYHIPVSGYTYTFPFHVDTYKESLQVCSELIDNAVRANPSPKYSQYLKRFQRRIEIATKEFQSHAVNGFLLEGQDYQMRIYLSAVKTIMDFVITHPTQAEFNRVDGIRETNRVKAMLNSEI